MKAFSIVEHLDVFEHVGLGRLPGGVPGTVHPLVFHAIEEALGGRIIPAVALAAHGTDHAISGELVLEGAAGILAAPIGVVHQARRRLTPALCHGQRLRHDVRRHPRRNRPTHDLPVKQIEHDGQVQPAFFRPEIGDIRCPDLIGFRRREIPLQQVVRHRQRVLRVGKR